MKKDLLLLLVIIFVFTGCSNNTPKQLSMAELEGLPIHEQVEKVIDNTKLIGKDYEIVVDDNSVAIIYPATHISDNRLVLEGKKDSFPNITMIFAEHLAYLELDELVITSYEPKNTEGITGLTKVSALLTNETIKSLNFEKWNKDKKDRPERFYRLHADAYFIRDNIWVNLSQDDQKLVRNPSRDFDSDFWDYYGKYVE